MTNGCIETGVFCAAARDKSCQTISVPKVYDLPPKGPQKKQKMWYTCQAHSSALSLSRRQRQVCFGLTWLLLLFIAV